MTMFGLYPATVTDVDDSQSPPVGRVQVEVDADPAQPKWAMPCAPLAGPGAGLYLRPEVGHRVWVAFEGGDPSKAVWLGGFWESGDLQLVDGNQAVHFLRTQFGLLTIDDVNEKLTLETANGMRIEMTQDKVTVESSSGAKLELGTEVTLDSTASGDLTIKAPHLAEISMKNGVVEQKGWPLKFAPPTEAVLARITTLEAEVAALKAAAGI